VFADCRSNEQLAEFLEAFTGGRCGAISRYFSIGKSVQVWGCCICTARLTRTCVRRRPARLQWAPPDSGCPLVVANVGITALPTRWSLHEHDFEQTSLFYQVTGWYALGEPPRLGKWLTD